MDRFTFPILYTIVLTALVGAFLYFCNDRWCMLFSWQESKVVTSFADCAAAGFPIMESYPRQCNAGGKHFVEEVRTPVGNDKIHVFEPTSGAMITSPLTIRGEARGPWYFEASFPVKLFDGNGQELVAQPAQAQGEWMTENFVPFQVVLQFEQPLTPTGTLVLLKDNPSGLPEHEDSISIPVTFNTALPAGTGILQGTVSLGPICPVEREGEPCQATPEMYASRKIFIYTKDKKTLLKTITPGSTGRFAVSLPKGTYYVDMEKQSIGSVSGLPQTVTIEESTVSIVNVKVDTGIR